MESIIIQIAKLESITYKQLKTTIKDFQSSVKKCFKYYKSKQGLEDYKMNLDDYIILFCLYVNTEKIDNKLNILLISMYSIYKLDDFHFSTLDFNTTGFLKFISENKDVHTLIYKMITDYTYIYSIKNNLNIQ
jgi:hypothetical protein